MIQMVLVYCMIENASVCVEDRPAYVEPMSVNSCMSSAQFVAVDYVRDHIYKVAMTSTGSEPENTHVANLSTGYTEMGGRMAVRGLMATLCRIAALRRAAGIRLWTICCGLLMLYGRTNC